MNQSIPTCDPGPFDARRVPCRDKHAQIFARWAALPVGGHFVLINDHDPVPLYYQFQALFPEAFDWEYLVDGPAEFQIRITRRRETPFATPPPPPRRPGMGRMDTVRELDLRGLEPPEPMIRILHVLEAMPAGSSFRARTDRQPIHLFPELAARGATHACESASDGGWITTITRG
jgi:uncharacterized protein (DUF2249 family)